MSLADEWHHPDGPEPLPVKLVDAQDALDFVHRGFVEAQDELLRAEAEVMDDEEVEETLVYRGPDFPNF